LIQRKIQQITPIGPEPGGVGRGNRLESQSGHHDVLASRHIARRQAATFPLARTAAPAPPCRHRDRAAPAGG